MQNPKSDFLKIKLNHKSGGFRSFRDFMENNDALIGIEKTVCEVE